MPDPPLGFVAVGHEKLFVRGADPFPCHHTFDRRYAGLLKFDIPSPIVRAVLRPVESRPQVRTNPRIRPSSECAVTIARAAEIWNPVKSSMPRTLPLFPRSLATDTIRLGTLTPDQTHPGIDVTSIAQEWQDGLSPNLGFVIKSNATFTREQSSLCLHHVAFEVEVEFEED